MERLWCKATEAGNLVGTDRSSPAILAASQLADLAQQTISVHVGEGLTGEFDWQREDHPFAGDQLYLYASFDVIERLELRRNTLASGG